MIGRLKSSSLEAIFLLSPCFIAWGLIFNLSDVKHILSKLISLICVYCFFFYKEEIFSKINKHSLFLSFLFFVGCYFSFLHYYNDGHFDFARAVFACFFYFLLVPSRVFNSKNLALLISLASVITIGKGIYDSNILDGMRIGRIVNSGPYAYICGLLLITQMGFFVSELKEKRYPLILFHSLVSAFLVYIIYLTGTRSAWLGLMLVLLYFSVYLFKNKGVTKGVIFSLIIIFIAINFMNIKYTHDRIALSINEVNMMINGNYNASAGTRVDLWRNGISIGSNSVLFGVSRSEEIKAVQKSYEQKHLQFDAYRILNHSRSSYHNVYVQSFVKGGLVAFFLMLTWVFLLILFRKRDRLKVSAPITIMTVICSGFESLFTIYSSCAYFYLLIIGYLIIMDRSDDKVMAQVTRYKREVA
ncbi:O-antigen ligase family protein [Vibrio sp.]|uniref:O-antigen ligase family protein n=1 Tax=Vibrio sp. TaxID=678 RepID=UPI00311F5C3E